MRGRKTVLLELPDDVEQRRLDALTPNKLRTEMLKKVRQTLFSIQRENSCRESIHIVKCNLEYGKNLKSLSSRYVSFRWFYNDNFEELQMAWWTHM